MPPVSSLRRLALATVLATALPAAPAVAQVVLTNPGTTFDAVGVSDLARPEDMAGMLVDVYLGDGTTRSGTWGMLFGNPLFWGHDDMPFYQFLMNAGGDTYDLGTDWSLATQYDPFGVVGFRLQGGPAGVVFDRSFGGLTGSPGSGLGRDFEYSIFDDELGTTVTYRNQVRVGGVVHGDLFETVEVRFAGPLPAGESETFWMDTDLARSLTPVPEPATLALVGGGLALLGLGAHLRRRGV